ncbi:hypothetical protein ABIC73_004356 [Prescottella equi]|uniref:hypothetical protein n=1 Tax=Rhodococcus hoagii TaxID=43767 RepID=UPI003393EB89
MNDDAVKLRTPRESTGGIRTIELLVLAACTFVVVGGFIAFCKIVWPEWSLWSWFDLGWWNHDRVSAAGAWFGGVATAASVFAAVMMARRAQQTSMRALRIELEEQSRKEQLQAVRTVWVRSREMVEALTPFSDQWTHFIVAKKARDDAGLNQDAGGLNSPQKRFQAAWMKLLQLRSDTHEFSKSVKETFLDALFTVTDPEVRAEVDKLHDTFNELIRFLLLCYANLPEVHPEVVNGDLNLHRITREISTQTGQLVVTAQDRLGRPGLPMIE